MVAQETIGGDKVHVLTAMRAHAHTLTVLVELQIGLDPRTLSIGGSPPFNVLVESGEHRNGSVGIGTATLGSVSVAEAGSASETIVQVQVEESGFAVPAMSAFDIVLAHTDTSLRVTGRCVVQGASGITVAGRASVVAKVVVVCVTTVALLSGNSWLALALALSVALQGTGPNRVAAAVVAVAFVQQVEVVLAALAVGSIAIRSTVDAMTSVAGQVVQVLVEVALGGVAIAVTSWTEREMEKCVIFTDLI